MKTRGALWMLLCLAVAMVVGLGTLLRWRLARGDGFPASSTLRADPRGTRALYESLGALPALSVERSLRPLEKLTLSPPRTVILAGMTADHWERLPLAHFNVLEDLARQGSRVVIALQGEYTDERAPGTSRAPVTKAPAPATPPKSERRSRTDPDEHRADRAASLGNTRSDATDWKQRWGLELKRRPLPPAEVETLNATRHAEADPRLPAHLSWGSGLHFSLTHGSDWRVLYENSGQPVLLERPLGRGTVVMMASTLPLSNEALQRSRATALLVWLVGPHGRVVFNEEHLGVQEDTGVAALARRYGLAGAFFTAALLAGLVIWRRMAQFVPPLPPSEEVALGYAPTAGIEALVRRAVPPAQLAAACLNEWRRSARAAELARMPAETTAVGAGPVAAYNRLVRELGRRP